MSFPPFTFFSSLIVRGCAGITVLLLILQSVSSLTFLSCGRCVEQSQQHIPVLRLIEELGLDAIVDLHHVMAVNSNTQKSRHPALRCTVWQTHGASEGCAAHRPQHGGRQRGKYPCPAAHTHIMVQHPLLNAFEPVNTQLAGNLCAWDTR